MVLMDDMSDMLDKYTFIATKQLYIYWGALIILSILCLAFLFIILFSNSRFHLKNLGYHTYIDLYKEIRTLNRKYKRKPIIINVNDKYYQGHYKFTQNNKLIIIPDEEIDIESMERIEK